MSYQTTNGARGPLRRDRRSKVIAGVCGGLGRHLDIDPVVFRILFAVFTFVGGLGLLAYAAAWLFVPQEGAAKSDGHRLLTGSNPLLALVVAIGLGFGVIASIAALTNGLTGMWPMWLLGAAGLGVLLWRGDIQIGSRSHTRPAAGRPATWWQQPVGAEAGEAAAGTPDGSAEGADGSQYPSTAADPDGAAGEPQDAAPPGYGAPGDPGASGDPHGVQTGDPGAAARPRRRGYGGLVLASLLAATGVLGVLAAAGAIQLTWLSGGALVLVLLGAGMVVGGLFGKTTSLAPIGIVLAVPLILLSAVGMPMRGAIGDENWTPASAAEIQPAYLVAVGDANLDLTQAVPGAGQSATVTAQVGIGDLVVTVPPNVEVQVTAHVGAGELSTNDGDSSRWNLNESYDIPAQTGKADGVLVLNLKVGIGQVEVDQ